MTSMLNETWVQRMLCLTLVCALGGVSAYAMQTDRWAAHTSGRNISALAVSESAIWAASSGGVFRYEVASGEISIYTVIEGMHDVQTRAIAYDARRSAVWIGYVDGVIDRIDVATGQVRTFLDIQRSERFSSHQINRMILRGDSLLVATSFGLVIFDPVQQEVRDTYSQFGSLTPATAVHDVIEAPVPNGRPGLWVATDEGVAYAALGTVNLQDPSAWKEERLTTFYREVYALAQLQGQLYIGTNSGLSRREENGRYTRFSVTDRRITDLVPLGDRLLAIDQFKLYAVFASGGSLLQADGFLGLTSVVEGPDGAIWVGDTEVGLNKFARPSGNERPALLTPEIYPEGPFDSPFSDLVVGADGALWATAVESVARGGFYRLGGDGRWTNFTGRFREELAGTGSFHNIHTDAQGNTWVASRGNGLAQVSTEGAVTVYSQENSTLGPAAGELSFIIVGGVDSEEDGTLWVTNTSGAEPMHVRTPNGEWTGLPAPICSGLSPTTALGPIFIDSFGLKWVTVLERGNFRLSNGLFVLDTGDSPTDASDDTCQYFGEEGGNGRGLPSRRITAITEDRTGHIWVGTDKGPAVFIATSLAARDSQLEASWPRWPSQARTSYVLRGLRINDIAVDPSNGIWMATNEGAYLVQDNAGYELIHRFTAQDSPLFSNVVNTIAVNGATGQVFFGTDTGLISYRGDAIDPVAERRDLFIYPNPVSTESDIYIEGLVDETEIRVIAVHGEIVRSLRARGGRARWDGRDDDQQLVPSGVYLVVAVGLNGQGAAYGKVAVIR